MLTRAPSPNSTTTQPPEPTTSRPRKQRRPGTRKMIYGYALPTQWLTDYAIKHNIGTPKDLHNARFRAIMILMQATGVVHLHSVRSNQNICGKALCIRIADNKSENGLKLLTQERIERFKNAMGMTEDPKWYEIY
jgi:hypothetical protein